MTKANGSNHPFGPDETIPLWSAGQSVSTSQTFDVISPLTDQKLCQSSAASTEDALAAVAAAEAALPGWRSTKPNHRRDLILRAAAEFESRREELWQLSSHEMGAAEAFFDFDFNAALDLMKSCAGLIASVQGTVPDVADQGRSAISVPEPYGVVLAVAPWNAPYILGLRSFLGPIAMGNTVVLKGPEKAPGCYWALADVFHKAGLPAGCLNTVIHRPEDGAAVTSALVAAPAVKKVNFTGSTAVGSIIAALAGKHLKPVLMELGGKAPAIVCDDADLPLAALQCTLGAFLHAGQICMSTERILVHESVADKFRDALKATIAQVFPAEDGLILVDKAPVEKNKALLADAVKKGAKLLFGDALDSRQLATAMRPVVVDGTKPGMDLYYTESFGPTVSLISVKSDDEAVAIANDTDYGLSSAVFTENLQRGLRIARKIETGAVHINSMSVHDETALPHGGAKKSGWGRFNGREGLMEWVRLKTITWKD